MLKIVWITNIQAPYREPLWKAISKISELEVFFLAVNEYNRTWTFNSDRPYACEVLRTAPFRMGESTLYALRRNHSLRTRLSNADVVIVGGWDSPAYWQVLLMVARRRRPVVVGFYEGTADSQRYTSGPVSLARSAFYRACSAALVVGRSSAAALQQMGVRAERLVELPNSVDGEFFARGCGQSDRRQEGGVRWLFVGQLIPRKNVSLMIDVIAHWLQAGDTLSIVGGGPLEKSLRTKVASLGLSSHVTFSGHVSERRELRKMYQTHDILVLPSEVEVFGLVVDEGMAAGTAVVVSEKCGIAPEVSHIDGAYVFGLSFKEFSDVCSRARSDIVRDGRPGTRLRNDPKTLAKDLVASLERMHRES